MKISNVLAIVLPSLVMVSCVSDQGSSAHHSPAGMATRSEESRIAVGDLVQAHNDYLAQVRNAGGAIAPSSVNCN